MQLFCIELACICLKIRIRVTRRRFAYTQRSAAKASECARDISDQSNKSNTIRSYPIQSERASCNKSDLVLPPVSLAKREISLSLSKLSYKQATSQQRASNEQQVASVLLALNCFSSLHYEPYNSNTIRIDPVNSRAAHNKHLEERRSQVQATVRRRRRWSSYQTQYSPLESVELICQPPESHWPLGFASDSSQCTNK